MTNRLGEHAAVIGGSIAGLTTARVLADYFDRVTVFERDQIENRPALHKSIPQGDHYHALLLGGLQVFSAFFPGFGEKLTELGAVRFRVGEEVLFDTPYGRSYAGASVPGSEPRYLGFDSYSQSRGLIEHCVRQYATAIKNVVFETGISVKGLVHEKGRVLGVEYSGPDGSGTAIADLVVDTGGRGSRAHHWLPELGFERPAETTIGVDFAYSSAKFRIPQHCDVAEKLIVSFGGPPFHPNGAILGQIEDGTWHVSLAGRFGNYPPSDEAGFLSFAGSIYSTRIYDLIKDAELISDIKHYRYPTSLWRHYERLKAFPTGFTVLGDAICSYNPVYGQGMSCAALQVQALHELLAARASESRTLDGLALEFYQRAANVIVTPWSLASAQDLAFEKTIGERPPDMRESAEYFRALSHLAAEDFELCKLMSEVFHLTKPISVLTQEPLRSRVLAQGSRATD